MPQLIWNHINEPDPAPGNFLPIARVFPRGRGYPDSEPVGEIYYGDNRSLMGSLLSRPQNSIDLIYVDPPFFTNRRYAARVGQGEDSRRPTEWQLAEGYADSWEHIDDYLDMLHSRLVLMHGVLAEHGTLYLHLDWHASHYARLVLDEIFGPDRLLNEIVWVYHGPSPIRSAFNRKHDTILVYTKTGDYIFNADAVREPYHPNTVKTFKSSPKAGFGKIPNLKRGKVPEDWWYFPVVARLHNERTGYPTQKPEALLRRIILASSHPGDLVADFFSGSGTTLVAAANLNRRFLGCDITWRAVHTSMTRLADSQPNPFEVYREEGAEIPQPVTLPGDITIRQLQPGTFGLATPQPELILAWEIDPNWDGSFFRSAAQAARPRTRADIAQTLTIPVPVVGKRICARIVFQSGEMFEQEIGEI
jgi:site-specific DNA-methyltransferase (adenine-specific)